MIKILSNKKIIEIIYQQHSNSALSSATKFKKSSIKYNLGQELGSTFLKKSLINARYIKYFIFLTH